MLSQSHDIKSDYLAFIQYWLIHIRGAWAVGVHTADREIRGYTLCVDPALHHCLRSTKYQIKEFQPVAAAEPGAAVPLCTLWFICPSVCASVLLLSLLALYFVSPLATPCAQEGVQGRGELRLGRTKKGLIDSELACSRCITFKPMCEFDGALTSGFTHSFIFAGHFQCSKYSASEDSLMLPEVVQRGGGWGVSLAVAPQSMPSAPEGRRAGNKQEQQQQKKAGAGGPLLICLTN